MLLQKYFGWKTFNRKFTPTFTTRNYEPKANTEVYFGVKFSLMLITLAPNLLPTLSKAHK